jgi:hypothetical protein
MSYNHRYADYIPPKQTLTLRQKQVITKSLEEVMHRAHSHSEKEYYDTDSRFFNVASDAIIAFVKRVAARIAERDHIPILVTFECVQTRLKFRFDQKGDITQNSSANYFSKYSMNDLDTASAVAVILDADLSTVTTLSEAGLARVVKEMRRAGLPLIEHMKRVAASSGKPLPDVAPEPWATRKNRRCESPSAFARRVYADWIGHGLTREDILRLDRPLYMAMAKALERKGPEDQLVLPGRDDVLLERHHVSPDLGEADASATGESAGEPLSVRPAAAEISTRRPRTQKGQRPLVDVLPSGLKAWPNVPYAKAPEHGLKNGIVAYLRRVLKPVFAAGIHVSLKKIEAIGGADARKAIEDHILKKGLPTGIFLSSAPTPGARLMNARARNTGTQSRPAGASPTVPRRHARTAAVRTGKRARGLSPDLGS